MNLMIRVCLTRNAFSCIEFSNHNVVEWKGLCKECFACRGLQYSCAAWGLHYGFRLSRREEVSSLLIGIFSGILLLHNVENDVTERVGNIEEGIKCISPSPTGDLLGIITDTGQLLVMTCDWVLMYEMVLQEIQEVSFASELEGLSVNIGGISISWRGDGKYFATMVEVLESGVMSKKIRIWESDSGALHSSSETKDYMKGILEWMPSGAKIAAVYKKNSDDGSPSIALFESNGLERSSSRIGEAGDAAVSCETLKWNSASDLLAGVVSCKTYDAIRVWFLSNNEWYLKQELRYPKEAKVRFMWDPTKTLQLICWTLAGQVTVRNFMWVTAVMEDSTPSHLTLFDSEIQNSRSDT